MKNAFVVAMAVLFMGLGGCLSRHNDGFNYGHEILKRCQSGACK